MLLQYVWARWYTSCFWLSSSSRRVSHWLPNSKSSLEDGVVGSVEAFTAVLTGGRIWSQNRRFDSDSDSKNWMFIMPWNEVCLECLGPNSSQKNQNRRQKKLTVMNIYHIWRSHIQGDGMHHHNYYHYNVVCKIYYASSCWKICFVQFPRNVNWVKTGYQPECHLQKKCFSV